MNDWIFRSSFEWIDEVVAWLYEADRPDLEAHTRQILQKMNVMEMVRTNPNASPRYLAARIIEANPPPVLDYQI